MVVLNNLMVAKMFNKFNEFFNNEKLCDINLKSGSITVSAHRMLLASASPYFEAMLATHDWTETRSMDINVNDVDPTALKSIINYLYMGDTDINPDNVLCILEGAAFLQLSELKNECEKVLMKNINAGNALGMVKYADRMTCFQLGNEAKKFISENFIEVSESKEFLTIEVDDLVELVKWDDINVEEEKVYEACIKWVKGDIENRLNEFPKIFEQIRLPLINLKYLIEVIDNEDIVKESIVCLRRLNEAKNCFLLPLQYNKMLKPRKMKAGTPLCDVEEELCVFGDWSFEIYNPLKNEWRKIDAMPKERRAHFDVAIVDDKLNVICSNDNGSSFKREVYDKIKNIWLPEYVNLTSKLSCGIALINNSFYSCMLCNETDSLGSKRAKNSWHNVFPKDKSRPHCKAFVLKDYLYVLTSAYVPFVSMLLKYCFTTKHWEAVEKLNLPNRCDPGVIVFKDKIYICGGYDSFFTSNALDVYDPADKGKWQQLKPMKHARRNPILCEFKNKIWVLGGRNERNECIKSVEIYDPEKNEWSEGPDMLENKGNCGGGGAIKIQAFRSISLPNRHTFTFTFSK